LARITKQNINEFQQKLLDWYEQNGRAFPWRGEGLTEYELIIAEILLQRTNAATISKFYQGFITRFPNWLKLDNASSQDVEEFLKPVGLYRQRTSRIKKLAKEMIERNGVLPTERNELETIPFFGQYIANSIELLIFNKPAPLIDVNMARLLERYFKQRKMADIRFDSELQALALQVVSHQDSKTVNWAILDFAALVCTARRPKCQICIFRSKCSYFKNLKK
jgi:A/G-specific adenine glycosylase